MRAELENKLFQRWSWLDVEGLEVGDGWYAILWRLFTDLEPLVAEVEPEAKQPFAVLRVREKLGGLRVYVNWRVDTICERIQAAEEESFLVCEICGEPGSRRTNRWVRVRCVEHGDEE